LIQDYEKPKSQNWRSDRQDRHDRNHSSSEDTHNKRGERDGQSYRERDGSRERAERERMERNAQFKGKPLLLRRPSGEKKQISEESITSNTSNHSLATRKNNIPLLGNAPAPEIQKLDPRGGERSDYRRERDDSRRESFNNSSKHIERKDSLTSRKSSNHENSTSSWAKPIIPSHQGPKERKIITLSRKLTNEAPSLTVNNEKPASASNNGNEKSQSENLTLKTDESKPNQPELKSESSNKAESPVDVSDQNNQNSVNNLFNNINPKASTVSSDSNVEKVNNRNTWGCEELPKSLNQDWPRNKEENPEQTGQSEPSGNTAAVSNNSESLNKPPGLPEVVKEENKNKPINKPSNNPLKWLSFNSSKLC